MASTSSSRPSSSSTPFIPQRNYDVFLSFRGRDTRYSFTDHLYKALDRRGIQTFRDDKLNRGEEIAPELLKTIEESRSSIIVFSENYAGSRWCLDELVKIMKCKKDLGHTVFPIFYHVDPSHVEEQTGSFGLAGYEENWKDKVERWRTALTEAANLSGWHLPAGSYESDHIEEVIDSIFHQLNNKRFDVGTNLVGIDSHIKEMISLLHMELSDVRMIGIYGIGGIGKTTITENLFNKLFGKFKYMSFLKNIREVFNTKDLCQLQKQLLGDMGVESQNIKNDAHGARVIKDILFSKRVFIVLDDVDDSDQLEHLLGNREWLAKGSRVIITTRNKHLLDEQEVDDSYEVKGLNFKEAYELFSLHAFKQNPPKSSFIGLINRVVFYCKGHPLALKVLGRLLFKKETQDQWEIELCKLEREPESKIHNVLKRSYDGLDHREKKIFLDIACFFKGEDRDFVLRILDGYNFYAKRGIAEREIKNLNDKCLITCPYNEISMHDLIQQMGWEIVREKFPDKPDQWSRLWDPRDIECALTTYEGIKEVVVETISLDLSKLNEVHFNSNVFAKMTGLRLLKVHSGFHFNLAYGEIVEEDYDVVMKNASKMQLDQDFKFPHELRYLCWDGYPSDILPSNFNGKNLVELHLKFSNLQQMWQGKKDLGRLMVIDLSYSKELIQMPEFSSMPNLERLILVSCVSLINIHPSIGDLKKLTTLDLRWCHKLKGLPSSISNLESLEKLDLSGCSSFEKFSEIQGLREPYLKETAIKELPTSIGNSDSLGNLDLCGCSKFEKFPGIQGNMRSLRELYLKETAIRELPSGIDLESIKILDLSDCFQFEKFPENGANMKSLTSLGLKNSAIKALPTGIVNWESLRMLNLSECSNFEKFPEIQGNMKSLASLYLNNTAIKDLPDSIGYLESLSLLDLSDCSKFEKFPEKLKGGNMKSLWTLRLKNTAIKDLPDSIGYLESLVTLDLSDCTKFEKFPEKGGHMKSLSELRLRNTAIKDLPDSIGYLESLVILDLSDCSKFEKFPEMKRSMKHLLQLHLRRTAIEELPSIENLSTLRTLNIGGCKNLRSLKLPSSLETVDAHDCRSKEDLSSLLWLCHLNWLKSATEELKCWKRSAVFPFPESSGIPEWIGHQNSGSEVTTELPMNWYEDPDFLGFVVSSVYQRIPTPGYIVYTRFCPGFTCKLNFHGNGFRFNDQCWFESWRVLHGNFNDQVWVWWYPKNAIPKEHHHKFTHFNASFDGHGWMNVKKCGVNLIFAGDQYNHPMLLDHLGNSGDNGSALQDTNGNVLNAPDDEHYHIPMSLNILGNFGDNGSVALGESNGNRKRSRDNSLPHAVDEPQYKRLASPNTDLSL